MHIAVAIAYYIIESACINSLPVSAYGCWMLGWSADVISSTLPHAGWILTRTFYHLECYKIIHCVPEERHKTMQCMYVSIPMRLPCDNDVTVLCVWLHKKRLLRWCLGKSKQVAINEVKQRHSPCSNECLSGNIPPLEELLNDFDLATCINNMLKMKL